jgi:hypothetical protein
VYEVSASGFYVPLKLISPRKIIKENLPYGKKPRRKLKEF